MLSFTPFSKQSVALLLLLCLTLISNSFAQIGTQCGVPEWYNQKGYPENSVVYHNTLVYQSSTWSQGAEPGVSSIWNVLGNCDEQLLISYPSLAYTDCANVAMWNNTLTNYNGNDIVNYQNGVFRANYWVAGTEIPSQSDAYTFLGICITPITISPTLQHEEVVIQSSLSQINLVANLESHGFTVVGAQIGIQGEQDQSYSFHTANFSNTAMNYNFTPMAYGDYKIQYQATNSIQVVSREDRTIKIALSHPPNVALVGPQSGSSYYQLNFEPIELHFSISATDQPLQSIILKDLTANTSSSIAISSSSDYLFNWTPAYYGVNQLRLDVADTQGTHRRIDFRYTIIDPSTENFSLSSLPNQLKGLLGVQKEFVFDQGIASVIFRDPTLINASVTSNKLIVNPLRAGRSGMKITANDGMVYYVGLRIDNADGSTPKLPAHIAIGSVSEDITDDVNFFNEGMNNTNLLLNNRMDVRYIYVNGGPINGWNTWQPDRVIKFARNSLEMGLIPFFVFYNIPDGGESYTTNLEHIQNPDYMTAYFENLKLFLDQCRETLGDEYFGIVLEPDFLGYMQQNAEPPSLSTSVGANTIGLNAGTLESLVHRINTEINAYRVSNNMNFQFGWQLNLWAKPNVAGVRGIIRETDTGDFATQLDKIRQTARDIYGYGNTMGIMSANADFISIDKYGLDAMGSSNNSNPADPSTYTWFWNNDHWLNYYEFVKALHQESGTHVILWQVPVGHINGSTTINAYTGSQFAILNNTSKHYEDSASTFFFGDEVDFSTDNVRFSYFGQNKHNDPKLTSDAATGKVVFGNHFEELNNVGVRLVLMGAGVGDSTDGIGNADGSAPTLTDDHFWIQKVQDYYINHLVTTVLGFTNLPHRRNGRDFNLRIADGLCSIWSNQNEIEKFDLYLFDLSGQLLLKSDPIEMKPQEKLEIRVPVNQGQVIIALIKTPRAINSYKLIGQ